MNKKTLLNTCLATLLSLTSVSAMAEIITSDAYVRAVPTGFENTAIFVKITNRNNSDVYLTKAASSVADNVELHNHVNNDGAMMMRPVDQIKIGGTQTVELAPGGYHIMLIDLKRDLEVGENIGVDLSFSDGTKVEFEAPVKKVIDGMHSHHHH